MRWFRGCIYSAALRREDKDPLAPPAPSEEETRTMQVDGLISHLQNNHSGCWPDMCWTKNDPTILLQNPTLCHSPKSRIEAFRSFLKKVFKLPHGQSIITFNRTSQNEAFNRVKLTYLDKRIDYWKSFAVRHAMAVIHYNEGYTYLLSEVRETYCERPFELEDTLNISMIENERFSQNQLNVENIRQRNKIRAEKYANERKELIGFNFGEELFPYKLKAQDRLRKNEFYPSFGSLIVDFDATIRCTHCHTFSKRFKGLCSLCYTYQVFGWNERFLDPDIMLVDETNNAVDFTERVRKIAENIFNFTTLRPKQMDAIKSYMLEKKDTLVIMKTGGGKSFCYAVSAILFDGLTIVISPLKSLIQSQMVCIKY